jgi:hypothetical protein
LSPTPEQNTSVAAAIVAVVNALTGLGIIGGTAAGAIEANSAIYAVGITLVLGLLQAWLPSLNKKSKA